jgi:hypothetical protein
MTTVFLSTCGVFICGITIFRLEKSIERTGELQYYIMEILVFACIIVNLLILSVELFK